MTHTTKIIIVGVLAVLAGIIYVEYPKNEAPSPMACTEEAKICPDGSSVGRSGPKCEFAACPEATTTARIGETITVNGIHITPEKVINDSRCPIGVFCIQAGTLTVQVKLEAQGKVQEVQFTLGQSVSFGGDVVTLALSEPLKRKEVTLKPEDYSFTFEVKRQAPAEGQGVLKGSVTVGPVCPVENPSGFSCTPTPEMYAAAKVFVYKTDKTTLVQTITPDAQGKFSINLPVGQYYIDMIHQRIGGTTGVPTTITIASGRAVTLSLHVDTGLR